MALKYGLILVLLSVLGLKAQDSVNYRHHTTDGFRNPFPGFAERGFGDFLRWAVWERIKGEKPERPDTYDLTAAPNDGHFLRNNNHPFTITWVGHSTLLVQLEGLNILTDPIWSERCSPVSFAGPKRHVEPGIQFDDLPPIDVVMISHDHYDHLDKDTIKKLGKGPLYLVPLGIGAFLRDLGIRHYVEMDWWDSIRINDIQFVCTPAQHFSGRSLFDQNNTLWSSWVVRAETYRFYFGGDTGYFDGFKRIARRFGPFDVAALPIGAYRPRWFMGPVHMSPEESVQAYLDLNARFFVPIHWGTFELADEPLDEPPRLLRKAIKKHDLNTKHFWILQQGQTRYLSAEPEKKADKRIPAAAK